MLAKKERYKALEQHDAYKVQKICKMTYSLQTQFMVIYALMNGETFSLYLYKKYKNMHIIKAMKQNSGFL